MQLSIGGKHLDVGEALTAHVGSGLSAVVERHFGRALEGRASFARVRHIFPADIVVHPARGMVVQSDGGYGVLHRRPDGSIGWIDAGPLPRG